MNESAGSVNVVVEVISGQFSPGVDHIVQLNLQDGTALGIYVGKPELDNFCMYIFVL